MGQVWIKNIMLYPKEFSDEELKDIPYPRLELYDHVFGKATQMGTLIGIASAGIVVLWKKRPVQPTVFKYMRNGFFVGTGLTPLMVEGALYGSGKSGPEEVYDRDYRLRYSDSQVRSAQWSSYGFLAGFPAGLVLIKPPVTRLSAGFHGALIGFAALTVASAVVPNSGREASKKRKEEKKEQASADEASSSTSS